MYTLPKLPYAYDALEPHIDAKTMEIHHTKHHQSYIDKLNAALEMHPDLQYKPVEDLLRSLKTLPESVQTAVRNHGGGHSNHSVFWTVIGPDAGGEPTGQLASDIKDAFGSFAEFKKQFTEKALGQFGSGWAWLAWSKDDGLHIANLPNQDSPYLSSHEPLLGVDVWEHAYYLKYQNKRPDYVEAFWNVVNWNAVAKRYDAVR